MVKIEKQAEAELNALRHNLLDLTMRNKLLNFRPTKRRTIQIVNRIPEDIYDLLVINERKLRFLHGNNCDDTNIFENGRSFSPIVGSNDNNFLSINNFEIISSSPNDVVKNNRENKKYLPTTLEQEELQKKLLYIYRQSNSIFLEQGYTVLYLALGFLKWTDTSSSTRERIAPLILVPVELERPEVRASFTVKWTGEDIFTNMSLQTKLMEQGISLPDFEMVENKIDINKYLQIVAREISVMSNWQVNDEIFLGFFSFTKFVMYKDLTPENWGKKNALITNPLIRNLLFPSNEEQQNPGFQENDVDSLLRYNNAYHVLDADPSQISVIEDAKIGRNLVVQGPPGTGKSQTIVNMIGELLILGKTVLFVSAKMAALEVVKNRLDTVGLGDSCLELHSRKLKKTEVLKEIERTINALPPKNVLFDDKIRKLETLRSELNEYAASLREPIGKMSLSPYKFFSLKEQAYNHFLKVNTQMPLFKILNPENISQIEYEEIIQQLNELSIILPPLTPIIDHPWYGCNLETVLPSDISEIKIMLDGVQTNLETLNEEIEKLILLSGVRKPTKKSEIDEILQAAIIVANSVNVGNVNGGIKIPKSGGLKFPTLN